MAEKLYYSMGEVSEMFDVNPSLIRYWGTQFDVLRPKRNKKGNRMFTPEDVENLKMIYHLVKEQRMTIEGARRAMKVRRASQADIAPDVELLERLQNVRAMLMQVREYLRTGESDIVADDDFRGPEPPSANSAEMEDAAAGTAVSESADTAVESGAGAVPEAGRTERDETLPFFEQTLF